jgi:hypothetical protein
MDYENYVDRVAYICVKNIENGLKNSWNLIGTSKRDLEPPAAKRSATTIFFLRIKEPGTFSRNHVETMAFFRGFSALVQKRYNLTQHSGG